MEMTTLQFLAYTFGIAIFFYWLGRESGKATVMEEWKDYLQSYRMDWDEADADWHTWLRDKYDAVSVPPKVEVAAQEPEHD